MNFGKAMRLIFDANIGFKIRRNKKAVKVLNYFSHSRFGMPSLHKKEHMTTPKHKLYTAAYNCFVEQGMTCVEKTVKVTPKKRRKMTPKS